jgi:hypothetical protein
MKKIKLVFEVNEKIDFCRGCKAVVNRSDYSGNYEYYCRVFDQDLSFEDEYGKDHDLYRCDDCVDFCSKD